MATPVAPKTASTLRASKPESFAAAFLNMIIYGLLGAGKTELLGTATECKQTSPMLLVDVEGGSLTLAGKDIDIIRPTSFRDLQKIYLYLRDHNDRSLPGCRGGYKSVGIDSVTEIQKKLSMGQIMGKFDDAGYKDLTQANPPDRRDWLLSSAQMTDLIYAFRDLAKTPTGKFRYHVFMTAKEKVDDDRKVICPQLPGILGVECGSFVDCLCRLSIRTREVTKGEEVVEVEDRYLAATEYDDESSGIKCLGKNRGGKLGKGVWRPTIGKIIDRYMLPAK